MAGLLLFTTTTGSTLAIFSAICALVSLTGFLILLYELVYDMAGYPDYKLPVWAVVYLLIYLVGGFTFLIFALHTSGPGTHVGGVSTDPKGAFLDSLYISTSNYIGVAPDPSFSMRSHSTRFLSVGQGLLSMFLNIVIITKFVNAF